MLNLKKVIASICVLAMVLSTVAFGATYTDVAEDSAYYEAVETLTKMGIVTGFDGEYRPEDGVTRAEMAALIARIQGYGETAMGNASTAFTDVPSSHWASGYIANASGMGIINGYGDGTFGPEDPVLYEQAIKMVMATLGYTPFAEKNGGYPTGYLAAAQRYNVSLAVANAAVGQEANRGTVAQILVNAIDTPLMVQAGWNTNGEVEYKIAEGELVTDFVWNGTQYIPSTTTKGYKTLMSENLGYVKIRGILSANDVTDIYGAKTIDTTEESMVCIDVVDDYGTENKKFNSRANNDFLVGDLDVDGLLGRSVIGYVKANAKDDFELISIAVDTNRNDELVINLDQLVGYDAGDGEIDYYKEGANTPVGVKVYDNDYADVVFNNVGIGNTKLNADEALDYLTNIKPNYGGSITLIDNDDYNGYDVAIVKMASTGVVDEVGAKAVSLKTGATLAGGGISKINLNIDETKVVKFIKDGEEIDASELNEWDILSIYAITKNSDYIVAEVISNEVVGTITSTKKSDTSLNGVAFKVGDAWYDVAADAYDEGMDINEGGTFYIDEFGKIAAFKEDGALAGGAAANYAYVKGIKLAEADFGTSGKIDVKLQLITAEGVEVYNLKTNATICAIDGTADKQIDIDTWADADEDNEVDGTGAENDEWLLVKEMNGKIVQYTKNSAGYITKLIGSGFKKAGAEAAFTAAAIKSPAGISDGTVNDDDVEYDAENLRFIKVSGDGVGGYVEEDALVFIVDTDAANCKLGSLADLSNKNKYTVLASAKDKKAGYASVLVVQYADVANASTTDGVAVITEVGDTTNDNGEAILAVSYLQNGELVSDVETTSDVHTAVAGNLTVGDIVKVKLGSEGAIVDIDIVWDFTSDIRVAKTGSFTGNKDVKKADGSEASSPANRVADDVELAIPSALVGVINSQGEEFWGGYVTAFAKNSKLFTVNDNNGKEKKDLKLTSAENVYVIDATGRSVSIDTGAAGDFDYLGDVLYGSSNVTITDDEGGALASYFTDLNPSVARKYADHIYVRMYEDKLVDVVIVKGAPITVDLYVAPVGP